MLAEHGGGEVLRLCDLGIDGGGQGAGSSLHDCSGNEPCGSRYGHAGLRVAHGWWLVDGYTIEARGHRRG